MSVDPKIAELTDRGFVRLAGADAKKLLQGLVTNDLETHGPTGPIYAGLLTPQGKILFDFFVVPIAGGFLIDIERDRVAEFVKRLLMYKLRADVEIDDVSADFRLFADWSDDDEMKIEDMGVIDFADPRQLQLGTRIIATAGESEMPAKVNATLADYEAHRVALGVPASGKDFELGDTYPHEAGFDLFNGVSFSKGCFVGQEVVSRMQNKTVVRKRVVGVEGSADLEAGAAIKAGDVDIGRVGSVAGTKALAMLRLDRAIEAKGNGITLTAAGVAVTPDKDALDRYAERAQLQTATAS